ncbi:hypothetical protein ACH5RR_011747 [Cinchona calisaya]|uniref:F-box protein n=1 Tax=Cinchona calisaya TaxID=153742 RepID=A0ABD3A5S4_9GENT
MDRGKRPVKFFGAKNQKIYMDLKDIIREHALQYLPAKSLLRFRSVCRDWKVQISTPFFAHNQSLSCRSISGMFCQTPGEPPLFFSFDAKSCGVPDPLLRFIPEPVVILSSSNGLLCCQSCSGDGEKAYYICNPITQQWKKLPKPNVNHGSDPAIVLVFEPSLLNFSADYKLICAFPSNDFDDAIEFDVYSSKEGSWKTSGEICFASRTLVPRSGVQMNNIVYWKMKQGGFLVFDLIKDRSQILRGVYSSTGTMGNMNGKLCSAYANGNKITLCLLANVHSNTMQISSHAKLWEPKQNVVLDCGILGRDAIGDRSMATVLACGDVLVVESQNSIYSYNLKTKETILLTKLSTHVERRFVPYVNSIVNI